MRLNHLCIRYGSYCNLRCKYCAEFNPYFSDEQYRAVDCAQTIKDVQKISSVVGYIDVLNVSGGEAFINKGIDELLCALLDLPNVGRFYIVTNGSYVPPLSSLSILALHKKRVCVEVSGYQAIGLPKKEVIYELEKHEIPFNVRDTQVWWDISDLSYREYSLEELKQKYYSCQKMGSFWDYTDGYLGYDCCRSNLMFFLNKYDECVGEWIKVSDVSVENLPEKMLSLSQLEYSNICRYCCGIFQNTRKIVPALDQLK